MEIERERRDTGLEKERERMGQSDLNKTKIKICGLFRLQDIDSVNRVRPDFAGFILTPGFRRSIDRAQAMEFRRALDAAIPAVGVFVDAAREEILSYIKNDIIQMIQLHGAETERDIRFLKEATGKPVMKAVKVSCREDIEAWLDSAADYLVLDGGTGAGVAFDWSLLEGVDREYFLAGGLHTGNLRESLGLMPFAVDISSGVETDGVKDFRKMQAVVNLVRDSV